MQLLEVKNDIAKILYSPTEKQLLLSDFILLEDINQSLICQITEIESSSTDNSNIATVKLSLSISKNSNLTTYNGYIPSKDANVIYISPQEIAQLIKSSKTNLYWGKLSSHSDVPIYIGLNFLRDKAYIRCDNVDNSELLNANLIYNLQFNKKRTVVFDTEGCFRHIAPSSVLTLGRDFKLPLNVQAFEFIATNDLTECSVESKAFIQGILIELEEYAQSLDEKFIPFSLFKKVIDEQAKFDSIPELLILRNKILRYEQFGLFAETEEQFKIFNDYLAKSTITTIDSSSVDEKYQKLLLRIITSQINKKCYLIFNATDSNTDKQTVAQIYDNNNIRPVVTSSYDYKYAPFLKSHCKNSVLFAPVDKRTDDDGYGLFQNKLRQKEFIVYGENTFYMPLILKLEAIDKNIFEKLLDDEIRDDVDKFLLRSSQKAKDASVIQNITDKDPSTIKFEDTAKKTPTIKPVNYVVTQTPSVPAEEKQFGEIIQEETQIDGFTTESKEEKNVYDIDTQEIKTVESEEVTPIEDLDIQDNSLPFSPADISQAYQEETGIEIKAEEKKEEDAPDIIIPDDSAQTEETKDEDNFLLNFSVVDTVEKEPEAQPEVQTEAQTETQTEDSNEVIIQTKEEDIEEQPIETDPAEEFFQQVVEKKEDEKVELETEEKTELKEEEQSSLIDENITFDNPDLSNINVDFSSSEELNLSESNSDFEYIKSPAEAITEAISEDLTLIKKSEDLELIDISGQQTDNEPETSSSNEIELIDISSLKKNEDEEQTSEIKEEIQEVEEIKEDEKEEVIEETQPNKDDITNDDLDFLDEYEGVEPEEAPQKEEPKQSILETYIDNEKNAETEAIKIEPENSSANAPAITSEMIQKAEEQEPVNLSQDNGTITFLSDDEAGQGKVEIDDNEINKQIELSTGAKKVPQEFDDLTEEDESLLDVSSSDDVLVINEADNEVNLEEIETYTEEEVDAKSLMEDFIEPPEEKNEPVVETQTVEAEQPDNQEQPEEITEQPETNITQEPIEEEKDNTATFSFVEKMMPEEEIPENEEEPVIQIKKETEETSQSKTEEEFLEVVNKINQTNEIETQIEPEEQKEAEETAAEADDDDKLFAAFNINDSVQVRRDKLHQDAESKRRIEQPQSAEPEQKDETRQDIPVYSAQTPQEQQKQNENGINYAVGDWVFHPKYGKGQVESFAHYSNKILFCTILFDNFGRRTLDAKLTGLQKIK